MRTPAPPIMSEERPQGYLAWRASSVVDQKQEGYRAVHVRLRLGDISSAQLRGVGDLLDRFGDGSLRFTIDQNVLIPWVDLRSLPALYGELTKLDLARLDIHTARDVTSCPGADTCNLAVTASRRLASAISERLEEADAHDLAAIASTTLKVSGCPNSCGQHHIADIGFHGGAKTFHDVGKTVPIYQLHLGGGVDERGARFGKQVVKLIARRVPEAVVCLLKLYDSHHTSGELPKTFFERVDPKLVVSALGTLVTAPPTREDEVDIGESRGFVVETREGECAA